MFGAVSHASQPRGTARASLSIALRMGASCAKPKAANPPEAAPSGAPATADSMRRRSSLLRIATRATTRLRSSLPMITRTVKLRDGTSKEVSSVEMVEAFYLAGKAYWADKQYEKALAEFSSCRDTLLGNRASMEPSLPAPRTSSIMEGRVASKLHCWRARTGSRPRREPYPS